MGTDKLSNVQSILNGTNLPEKKVKKLKKENGLFERTECSATLLTEDNKIVLMD
jgi:hypothetical protein